MYHIIPNWTWANDNDSRRRYPKTTYLNEPSNPTDNKGFWSWGVEKLVISTSFQIRNFPSSASGYISMLRIRIYFNLEAFLWCMILEYLLAPAHDHPSPVSPIFNIRLLRKQILHYQLQSQVELLQLIG